MDSVYLHRKGLRECLWDIKMTVTEKKQEDREITTSMSKYKILEKMKCPFTTAAMLDLYFGP